MSRVFCILKRPKIRKLSSIEDESQTNTVSWPWPVNFSFYPVRLVVLSLAMHKIKVKGQSVWKVESKFSKQTDRPTKVNTFPFVLMQSVNTYAQLLIPLNYEKSAFVGHASGPNCNMPAIQSKRVHAIFFPAAVRLSHKLQVASLDH